jgi:hypothetical protein
MSRTASNCCPTPSKFRAHVRSGFSLLDWSVALLLVGAVVAVSLSRNRQHFEQANVVEAFRFLDSVRKAQSTHLQTHGAFCARLCDLDLDRLTPVYFTVGDLVVDTDPPVWSLTLTRCATERADDSYQITFDAHGYDASRSDVDSELVPQDMAAR